MPRGIYNRKKRKPRVYTHSGKGKNTTVNVTMVDKTPLSNAVIRVLQDAREQKLKELAEIDYALGNKT